MCVTFCIRRNVLYQNHFDCSPTECQVVGESHGHCLDCRHQQDKVCGLTQAPLPAAGGCCHWNVEPMHGPLLVSREMLAPLHLTIDESEVSLLKDLGVPYHWSAAGELLIDLADLSQPATYGLGSEPSDDDPGWELEELA
jgi:hypothetical protein